MAVALEETTQEFRDRGGISISLATQVPCGRLGANEGIHILQVVREALSNVIWQAQASEAWVSLACDREGRISVLGESDGVGLQTSPARTRHHGLSIMEERARTLGAELHVFPREQGSGTRVALSFAPGNRDGAVRAVA